MHTRTQSDEQWLSVAEAAVFAGRSVPTIFRWIRAGRLRAYSVAGRTRIRVDDLRAALAPELRQIA